MGQKTKEIARVVLDTNVLVSALILKGRLNTFVDLRKQGKIIPLLSKATFHELTTVLRYRKFALTAREIESLLATDVLPFFDVVDTVVDMTGTCRDPEDDNFLSCALSGSADFLVTGDKDLLELATVKRVRIVTPAVFLEICRERV
jgi:uncharacterized protein